MKNETQTINTRKKIVNDEMLLYALKAEATTIEVLKSRGRNDCGSFLASYIQTGRDELFTRENGIRDKMLKIDRKELKKEILIMLYAQIQVERLWPRFISKNLNNKRTDSGDVMRHLFEKISLDTKEYDKAFDYLIENYPHQLNEFITEKVKNFLGFRGCSSEVISDENLWKNERLWDEINNQSHITWKDYHEDTLKQIENYRKGKKRFKVISVKQFEKHVNNHYSKI